MILDPLYFDGSDKSSEVNGQIECDLNNPQRLHKTPYSLSGKGAML